MKSLLFLTLIINVVSAASSYLDGLNRTFDDIEQKIVDIYVTMPEEQVRLLDKTSGSSSSQTGGAGMNAGGFQMGGAGMNAGGFQMGGATNRNSTAGAAGTNAGGIQMGGATGRNSTAAGGMNAGGFGGFPMGGAGNSTTTGGFGGFQMGGAGNSTTGAAGGFGGFGGFPMGGAGNSTTGAAGGFGGFQMGGAGGFGGFQMGGAGGFGGFGGFGNEFKYDNATIVMKWDGNEKTYENSSFKVGGANSVSNDKLGYNIKLSKKFLGRKNIRIRPDCTDRSFLRAKLCCDMANRMGVPSIQASYARLYMNNEFWGFYVLLDAVKPSWIKQTFSPSTDEITTLYQCKTTGMEMTPGSDRLCVNANDDIRNDMTLFSDFIKEINSCETAEEVEKILDVDVFLKYMAFEWLIGSFDHFLLNGHNFYFYKRETDGKWLIIEYDYDSTMGVAIKPSFWDRKGANQDGSSTIVDGKVVRGEEPIFYTFSDWEMNRPIIDVLVHKNKDKFKSIMREVLVSSFNPYLLKPRIAELKEFVAPFIKEDFAPGSNGLYPGRINPSGKQRTPTFADFEETVDYVYYWVDTKFEVACENYGFDPEEIMKEAATYVAKPFDYASYSLGKKEEGEKVNEDEKEKVVEDEKEKVVEDEKEKVVEDEKEKVVEDEKEKVVEDEKEKVVEVDNKPQECWANKLGYNCCKTSCNVYSTDESGKWSVENGKWCGIIESQCNKCYGETIGKYPCCQGCNVAYTDKDGQWGIENNKWCSIKFTC